MVASKVLRRRRELTDKFLVVVLMEQSLLENGIVQRLMEDPGIDVRVMKKDWDDIPAKLGDCQPDVIILDDNDAPLRGEILAALPDSTVVTVGFEQDGAVLYRPRRLSISTVKELVDHLKGSRRTGPSAKKGKRKSE